MKKRFFKKVFALLVFVPAFIAALSFVVMAIWNNVLVAVLHIGVINFWQALSIFVLAKILFGGFPGGGRFGGSRRWKEHMGEGIKEKWMKMTPEERESLKQNWKGRCSKWGRQPFEQNTTAPANANE